MQLFEVTSLLKPTEGLINHNIRIFSGIAIYVVVFIWIFFFVFSAIAIYVVVFI